MANVDPITFNKFKGLRNTVTPERLGVDELARAVNVDIDDAGELRRRRGFTLVSSGDYHSLYREGAKTFVVKDGNLCLLLPNYTTTTIKPNVGVDPLAYVTVGDETYFSSRSTSGVIKSDNTVADWGERDEYGEWLSPVLNPTDSLPAVAGKLLAAPPLATALTHLNGRIYLAAGKSVWATELYLYNYIDKTKNFMQFEDGVTALAAVADGIYVGTESAVYFLSGPLNAMRRVKVFDAGVNPGSVVYLPADLVRNDLPSKTAIMFLTTAGLCVGLDSGTCYNLTQTRVLFPSSNRTAAMFRQQDGINQYVGVTDSGGTPTTAARFGDYVDGEIRRFQGA
jgi:hypothetical protein